MPLTNVNRVLLVTLDAIQYATIMSHMRATRKGCSFGLMYPIWCKPIPLDSERRSQELIGHKTGSNQLKPATDAGPGVWGVHQAETAPLVSYCQVCS
jgi:hypothetical protein